MTYRESQVNATPLSFEAAHGGVVQARSKTGTAEARTWAEQQKNTLLAKGSEALRAELAQQRKLLCLAAKRAAIETLDQHLAPHANHTDYAGRLVAGSSMGSGVVEGAGKTVVGRRLKQTGARWRVRNVESCW